MKKISFVHLLTALVLIFGPALLGTELLTQRHCNILSKLKTLTPATSRWERLKSIFSLPTAQTEKRKALAHEENLKTLSDLNDIGRRVLEVTPTKRRLGIDSETANLLLQQVRSNPVAAQSNLRNYDPDGQMGFCFGRAAFTDFNAVKNHNVHPKAIRKLYFLGELKNGSTSWRYHVTTIIRGEDGKWYAIDPIIGSTPVTAEKWYEEMRRLYDPKKMGILFQTPNKQFGTDSVYSKEILFHEKYRNYFIDLLNSLKKDISPDSDPELEDLHRYQF